MAQAGVKSTMTAQDDGFINQQELIVGQDDQGRDLTHYVLAERVLQCEYHMIVDEAKNTPSSETLIYILEGGFRGFHNMSPGELWSEWKTKEALFTTLHKNKNLPWELYDGDPLLEK
jgi:hypothetical protein